MVNIDVNSTEEEIEALGLDPKFPSDLEISVKKDPEDRDGDRSAKEQLIYDAFGQDIKELPDHFNLEIKKETSWRGAGYDGVRFSADEGKGFGEHSHRAIRSYKFPAAKFREKFLEMSAEARRQDQAERQKKQERKETREKKEKVKKELQEAIHEVGVSGRHDLTISIEDQRIRGKAEARGIKLELKELSYEDTRLILAVLEYTDKLQRALNQLTQLINIANMHDANNDRMETSEVVDMAGTARKKLNQFVGRAE